MRPCRGAADNLGLGYWTHQLQVAGALYFLQKATAIVVAATDEFNMEKEDVDITPGQGFSLNYGVPVPATRAGAHRAGDSRLEPVADHGRFGVDGHEPERARSAPRRRRPDRVRGAAVEARPAAKSLYQYYADDRFKGQEFTPTVGYQFF